MLLSALYHLAPPPPERPLIYHIYTLIRININIPNCTSSCDMTSSSGINFFTSTTITTRKQHKTMHNAIYTMKFLPLLLLPLVLLLLQIILLLPLLLPQ